jgi:hypothetical protein
MYNKKVNSPTLPSRSDLQSTFGYPHHSKQVRVQEVSVTVCVKSRKSNQRLNKEINNVLNSLKHSVNYMYHLMFNNSIFYPQCICGFHVILEIRSV